MSPRRALLLSLAVFGAGLVAADLAIARYASYRFLPAHRMADAVAQGQGCVAFAGDSRVVAALDDGVMRQGLRDRGLSVCVANFAIGALKLPELAVAVREYLRRGVTPRALVLGVTTDLLLPADTPADSVTFVGNEAIALGWSQRSDLERHFPQGWFDNPGAFDRRFRFVTARSSAIGSYLSIGWQKVQALQDALSGHAGPRNEFGALADMAAYSDDMEAAARTRLRRALTRPEEARLSPWFVDMEAALKARGAQLLIVELPMPERFRRAVTDTAEARLLRAWLGARLASRGETLIDLSSPDWLRDEYFSDALHLSSKGAAMFSAALAQRLAAPLTGDLRPAPAPR